jgi:mono/diheme cytochrome c family protein
MKRIQFPYMKNFALLACVAGAIAWSAKADDVKLPDGEGKDLVQKTCSACHGVDTATSENHTAAEWKAVVDTMVSRGAEGTDAEFATIVKYLAANYGPKK